MATCNKGIESGYTGKESTASANNGTAKKLRKEVSCQLFHFTANFCIRLQTLTSESNRLKTDYPFHLFHFCVVNRSAYAAGR
jgi:hypothetical protein